MKSDRGKSGLSRLVDRRVFIGTSMSALAGLVFWHEGRSEPEKGQAAPPGQPRMVRIAEFSNKGTAEGIVVVPKIVKSHEE